MALPFCAVKNMHNESHCLSVPAARTKRASPHHFQVIRFSCENRAGMILFLRIKKSTQNVPIQKNGFFRHREHVQNPSVFKSLVLFKDRMVTNCLMQFCLAIPCRQIACLPDILPHWKFICKGKINFHQFFPSCSFHVIICCSFFFPIFLSL